MYYAESNRLEPVDVDAPQKYLKYKTTHVTDIREVENGDNIVIVPEAATAWISGIKNCKKALYSYTMINPCNHVIIFDKTQYLELKNTQSCDISFVGAMYNEKHNLFKRLDGISDYTRGYLESIMKAQRKVYGYYFLQEMLTPQIIADMQKACPLEPSLDGVETIQYLYADIN